MNIIYALQFDNSPGKHIFTDRAILLDFAHTMYRLGHAFTLYVWSDLHGRYCLLSYIYDMK